MKIKYQARLVPANFYHVYNRANQSDQLLFKSGKEANIFLNKWRRYSQDLFDTYAYCLMPNHFHLIIRIRPYNDEQRNAIELRHTRKGEAFLLGLCSSNDFYASIFQAFFNSYAATINNREDRRGSIFQAKFKRTLLTCEDSIREKIQYVHRNPIHHGFCKGYSEWPHSSYRLFMTPNQSWINKSAVLRLYEGAQGDISITDVFAKAHWEYLLQPYP